MPEPEFRFRYAEGMSTPLAAAEGRSNYRITFAVLSAAVAAYALLQSLVVPVLPTIQHSLHTSQATVTWVLTAYLLSASIFTPIMGRVGDMVGKKRVFIATLGALAAGSLIAAMAHTIGLMIVARVIQGIGGGVMPLAFGIIRDEFPGARVPGAVGSLAALTAVGGGLGVVLAGPIVETLDYHWLFWIPMALILAAGVVAIVAVPESPNRSPGRLSILPAVLLSGWLVALLVALSEAPTWGWGSGRFLGLAAVAVVLVGAWARSEQRAVTPLIDLRMMRIPAVWTTNLVALLVGVGMYAVMAFLPELVQTPSSAGYGFGASITQSGLILLPSTATMFIAGLLCGRLVRALGSKAIVVIGCGVSSVSMLILAGAHSHRIDLYLATGIMGVGFGMAFSAMSSLIVESVPRHQTGVASGMNANIRTIGGSVGAALMASIVTSRTNGHGVPLESGYTHGFLMLAGAVALAVLAGLLIPRPSALPGHEPGPDDLLHPELGLVAAGTVLGDEPE